MMLYTSISSPQCSFQSAYSSFLGGYDDCLEANFDGTGNSFSILGQIYLSGKVSNKVYNLTEMMKQPDRNKFEEAMAKEVQDMFTNKIWKKVPKAKMLQYYQEKEKDGIKVDLKRIMMIWSFKRKRHPDGTLSKYKARLCCHGGQQQWGVQFWETYAPIVSWIVVRTLLVLSKVHKLHTQSIDFMLAYPQADIKVPIFLHTPQGMVFSDGRTDTVLMLLKNLYRLKDTGRT